MWLPWEMRRVFFSSIRVVVSVCVCVSDKEAQRPAQYTHYPHNQSIFPTTSTQTHRSVDSAIRNRVFHAHIAAVQLLVNNGITHQNGRSKHWCRPASAPTIATRAHRKRPGRARSIHAAPGIDDSDGLYLALADAAGQSKQEPHAARSIRSA